MTINKKILFGTISLLLLVFFMLPQPTYAASDYLDYNKGWEIIPSECLDKSGDCNPDSFIQLFVNLASMMIKILPTLAMLMLIIGGLAFISSAGNPERVQKGKKIISTVVLGVILIIGVGWTLSFFIVTSLTGEKSGKIFGSVIWWAPQGIPNTPTPSTGCCVVTNFGCMDNTSRLVCDTFKEDYKNENAEQTYWQPDQLCNEIATPCQNYRLSFKCCVPSDLSDTICYEANENGCLNNPDTITSENECTKIGQCLNFQ